MSTVDLTGFDLGWYDRIACCFTASAVAILDEHGLHVPDRVETADYGKQGDPDCCEALLVKLGNDTADIPQPGLEDCGPFSTTLTVEVRLFRPVCQQPSSCDHNETDDCRTVWCPTPIWPSDVQIDPCASADLKWERRLIRADRYLLRRRLATIATACLCEAAGVCPDECGDLCGTTIAWTGSEVVSGGGCAGSKHTYTVKTVG